MDFDKKVLEKQKKRPGLYQSEAHPEHFKNEGGEYAENTPENPEDKKNNPEFDYDKANGIKK